MTTQPTLRAVPDDAEPSMTSAAFNAITAIEAARAFGLPFPFAATFTDYREVVELSVRGAEAVAAWASHMGVEPAAEQVALSVHHRAVGTIAGVEVRVVGVVR